MPSATKHAGKASSNRRFLDSIDIETAADWAVVVGFYTAVHLIEQLRALDGQHSQDHQSRLYYVLAHHRRIHASFHELYNLSKLARYTSNEQFFKQLTPEDVRTQLIAGCLVQIEDYVKEYVAQRTDT